MKGTIIFLILVWASFVCALPIAWVNEIHYDNVGTDHDEFVEVVVLNPENHYLDDIALYMINGSNGRAYCLNTVQDFTPGDRVGDYQFYVWYQRGIQNDCEGMHLVFKDSLLDILAYEGSFAGVTAPSTGLIFPDVGVSENPDTPDTCSIYLCGHKGSEWAYGTASPGSPNPGQCLLEVSSNIKLIYFKIKSFDFYNSLIFQTGDDSHVKCYTLYKNNRFIACLNKNETNNYKYNDKEHNIIDPTVYVLSWTNYSGIETFLDTLEYSLPACRDIGLGIPFPNPFNPVVKIPICGDGTRNIELQIYDLSGKMILNKSYIPDGTRNLSIDMSSYPSGNYIVKFTEGEHVITRQIFLQK